MLVVSVRKLGRVETHQNITEPYGGGIAFQTYEAAREYAGEGYAVYGLLCGWDNTYLDTDLGQHRILESTRIVAVQACNRCDIPMTTGLAIDPPVANAKTLEIIEVWKCPECGVSTYKEPPAWVFYEER